MENLIFEGWNGNVSAIAKTEKEVFKDESWSVACILDTINFPLFFGEVCKAENGDFVGYYGMNIVAGEGYIANIAVAKKYQSKGIGKKLMQRLIDETCEKCSEITLEVRVSNQKAINLYKKFNFECEAVRKNFYPDGEDAFIMWKRSK